MHSKHLRSVCTPNVQRSINYRGLCVLISYQSESVDTVTLLNMACIIANMLGLGVVTQQLQV